MVLIRVLSGAPALATRTASGPVHATGAWDWGPMLVARTLWRELALDTVLTAQGGRSRADGRALAERALVAGGQPLVRADERARPGAVAGDRLRSAISRDGAGRPPGGTTPERRASRQPRVRVEHYRQLKQWYRTLDQLHARQPAIEQALYLRLRDLFSLKVDLVFYDLTSTYFEGHGPPQAAHGHSRDGKPRNRQVLVGVVMVDRVADRAPRLPGQRSRCHDGAAGPRGYFLFGAALRAAPRGVRRGPRDGHGGQHPAPARARAGLRRPAPASPARGRLPVHRARHRSVAGVSGGTDGPRESRAPTTQVQEVASEQPGVRIFVVQSDERLAYERTQREQAMARVRAQLEALERRVAAGRLTDAAKIGAAAARILTRWHGSRYYDWAYTAGVALLRAPLQFEHPVNLTREAAYEGKYVIQTEEPQLTPVEAVQIYKELSEVERAFANLKDVIELRPDLSPHRTRETRPTSSSAALAFLLHRTLEKKLKAAGLDVSATEALRVLRTVRLVEFTLSRGRDQALRHPRLHPCPPRSSPLWASPTSIRPPRPRGPRPSCSDNPVVRPSLLQ